MITTHLGFAEAFEAVLENNDSLFVAAHGLCDFTVSE